MLRDGDKLQYFESLTLLPELILHWQNSDRDGLYVAKTSEPPNTLRNIPEGARILEYVFISPSASRQFCNSFTCVVGAMDASFRKHLTGGVEMLKTARDGLGKNTTLCIGMGAHKGWKKSMGEAQMETSSSTWKVAVTTQRRTITDSSSLRHSRRRARA